MCNWTMAGLLTGPGSGLLIPEGTMAWIQSRLRTTQLRAQFRIHTGFPIEPAGKDPGRSTIISTQRYKKKLRLPVLKRIPGEIAVIITLVPGHFIT